MKNNKFISPEKFWKQVNKKRMGAGVIFFNDKGEILLVKAEHKKYWSLPGGVVDENESPRMTAIREVKEEISLSIKSCEFLCVDYESARNIKGEALQFIFYGGVLDKDIVNKIKIDNEIQEYKFVLPQTALKFLNKRRRKRFTKSVEAIKNKKVVYLENGE